MTTLWQPHYRVDDERQAAIWRAMRLRLFDMLRGREQIRHIELSKADSDAVCYQIWRSEKIQSDLSFGDDRPATCWFTGIQAILDQPETRVVYRDETDAVKDIFEKLAAQGFSG